MKILSTLLGVMLFFTSMAQQNNEFFTSPKITPASPEASSLFRLSETPVDYSSGSFTQTIPLYTITAGRIICPISISYNTVGIKVQDIASMIGLGWNLNWGGIIYEQGENYNGESIDEETTVKTEADVSANVNNDIAWMRLHDIAEGNAEKQKADFYFNFGEYSGVFFYDVNNIVHIKSGNHNLRIEKVISPDNNYFKNGFKITTDKGIQYTFLDIETAVTLSSNRRKTAYLISRIEDLNGSDYVDFLYEEKPNYNDYSSESYNDFRLISNTVLGGSGCAWPNTAQTASYIKNLTTITSKRIASISSSNGSIHFNASSDRMDVDPVRITDMVIISPGGLILKNIKFNQSYFVSNASIPKDGFRLKLDGISFFNNSNTKAENYIFSYNSLLLPPYRNSTGSANNTGVDYWGYYNGKNTNAGLIPQSIAQANGFTNGMYQGNRSVDPAFTQACILNKIQFPTGGFVNFIFENNTVDFNPLDIYAGGLRLKQAVYYTSPLSLALTKLYKYFDATIPLYQITNNYVYDKRKDAGCGDMYTIGPGHGSTAYGTKNISSSPVGLYSYFNLPVFYQKVEEYTTSGTSDLGKTVYTFNPPEYVTNYLDIPELGFMVAYEKKWANDKLLKQTDYYRKAISNEYRIIKKEENLYTDYNNITSVIGLQSIKKAGYDYVNNVSYFNGAASSNPVRVAQYHYFNANNSSGIRLLTQKKVTEYLDGYPVENTTNYEYEITKYQLKRIAFQNSKGENNITIFKYPYESTTLSSITPSETSVLDLMVNKNMLTIPVEQETYKNATILDKKRNIYFTSPYNNQHPKTYLEQSGNNVPEIKTHFTEYDQAGKLLEYRSENSIYKSAIYDVSGDYPIAEVTNAQLKDIAYTSFEKSDLIYSGSFLGNWQTNFNGYSNDGQLFTPMGKRCLQTTVSTSFTRNNLLANTVYIVSYWSKTDAYAVTGTIDIIQGKTINGWTNFIHRVTGNMSISVFGKSGFIDELRLYPFDANIVTYENFPLVGLASLNDPNSNITYYEYDDFQRLSLIRDHEGNIVKTYCYNYAGQQSDCSSGLPSNPQPACSPISTLPCAAVQVSLPFALTFSQAVENSIPDKNNQGIGFTTVDAYSGTRLSADGTVSNSDVLGYEASKLTLGNGQLQILSNKGIAYLTNNNQINSLGVKFNSQNKYQVETVLVNPFNGTSAQQAGIWIGQDDRTFLKLVAVGNKLEFRKEVNDVSTTSDLLVTGTISGLDIQNVNLRVVVDPITNIAEGFYSIDGTNYIRVGNAGLSITGMGLTGSTALAGIFATHRSSSTAVTYTFDNFSVNAILPEPPCFPTSTLPCSAVQVSVPFALNFNQAIGNTIPDKNNQGVGFTMVDTYSGTRVSADGTVSNSDVPAYEASKLTLGNGQLQILSNKGIAYLTNNNQINTLGVQFNSQNKYQVETVLVNPFNGTSAQQAGIWIGQDDRTFLKLVAVGNKLEFRKEVNDVSTTSDLLVTGTISGLDIQTVNLRVVVDPITNVAEGFYSIDGTNYIKVGNAGLSTTGMGLTGNTALAGIFATHRSSSAPVTYTFDNFSISNPPLN